MTDVKLTVAICTWNRASLLEQTLEQISRMRAPEAPWEIIVVNNNCTDETPKVLTSFLGRLPLRIVLEPRPGQSHARNAAVDHSNGDYIIWTDDDVLVDEEWLRSYERAFSRWPDAAVFGGPIRPWFDGTPPRWLSETLQEVADAFAMRDLGNEPLRLDGKRMTPYGANYAVRMAEQRAFRYDPKLGKKMASGCIGDETTVICAIIDAGHSGWWVPNASVKHFIPKQRQTTQYIREYFGLWGRTIQVLEPAKVPTLFGRPRWALRRAIEAEITYRVLRVTGDPRRWIGPLRDASICWGVATRLRS